jgi:hypothetical protein
MTAPAPFAVVPALPFSEFRHLTTHLLLVGRRTSDTAKRKPFVVRYCFPAPVAVSVTFA